MAKDKPFADALRKRIAAADQDPRWLDRIAVSLLSKAERGDVNAIKEIADRLDGKVPQSIGGTDELPPIITQIETVIVDPKEGE